MAANTSIILKDNPFDAMNRLRCAEPYVQQGPAAVACRKGTNERKGEEGEQKKKERERETEREEGTRN